MIHWQSFPLKPKASLTVCVPLLGDAAVITGAESPSGNFPGGLSKVSHVGPEVWPLVLALHIGLERTGLLQVKGQVNGCESCVGAEPTRSREGWFSCSQHAFAPLL